MLCLLTPQGPCLWWGGGLLGGHRQEGAGGRGDGGEGCLRVGRGERGAWGLGVGRQEQYCCASTPGARCQPEQKGRVSNSEAGRGGAGRRGRGGGGGGRREPPPAPALQPLPVNPCSATLLKKGGASGGSPLSPGLFRDTTSPLVLWEMWLCLGSVVAGLSFPFLKA